MMFVLCTNNYEPPKQYKNVEFEYFEIPEFTDEKMQHFYLREKYIGEHAPFIIDEMCTGLVEDVQRTTPGKDLWSLIRAEI